MSIRHMTLVWEHSKHEGSALLLLLAIADCANDDGEAWPGADFMAHRIRMSRSYVRKLIKSVLLPSKEIKKVHGGGHGPGDAHRYKICIRGTPVRLELRGILVPLKGHSRGTDHAQIFTEPLRTIKSVPQLPESSPPPPFTNPPTKPVGVVGDEWDLSRLLKLGRATKSRMAEIAAMDPAPSASAYVAQYLYGMTIHKINAPAHFAAKRLVEQLEAGEPFETLAGQGPQWLTECLHWVFTGGVEAFDDITPQALALRNYLPIDVAARLIPRAFDELGLSAYLPKPVEPEPVGEYIPPERPVLDEWQAALERLRPHYRPPTMQSLEQCKLIGRENGTMLIAVPNPHMLKWFEVQKIAAGMDDYGVAVAFQLRENHAES